MTVSPFTSRDRASRQRAGPALPVRYLSARSASRPFSGPAARSSPRRRRPALWYCSSSSIPIQPRPHWSVATQVEPEPAKGSRIKSTGFLKISISGCNTLTDFLVGWCRLPMYCQGITPGNDLAGSGGHLLASR